MRPVAPALLALLLAVAGCVGAPGGPVTTTDGPATDTTRASTATPTSTTTSTTITLADPANLSADRAKELALQHEKAYLSARLRNDSWVDDWGVGPGIASKEARVVDRNATAYVVEVKYPYWYTHYSTGGTTTSKLHADAISKATWVVRVTADGRVVVRRRSGTEVV